MGKKKKRGGGGGGGCGGGGGGQQQQEQTAQVSAAAAERDDQAIAIDVDAATATGGEGKDKAVEGDKEKGAGKEQKDKEKKAPPLAPMVTVLKVDMHCDGCAHRIRASVRRFPGVEGVGMEVDKGTMTVVGCFDAKKLRDRVAHKTKKKVDLVGNNNKGGGGGGNQKGKDGKEGKPDKEEEEEHEKEGKEQDDKGGGNAGKGKGGKDSKKPAVPVVGTVVLKIGSVGLHCDGCMHRIRTKLFKIKGVEQVRMEIAKNQVTVTGTMDIKALPEKLRKKLCRPVDVVPPNNNRNNDNNKQQDGKDKDGKQGDGKGKGKDAEEKTLAAEVELWKGAFYNQQALQATEFMLSDENPNACSLM